MVHLQYRQANAEQEKSAPHQSLTRQSPERNKHTTRVLSQVLGDDGAAALHSRLLERVVDIARVAGVGPVTLWAAPNENHPAFQMIAALLGVALARQPDADLGGRMLAAMIAANGPVLVIAGERDTRAPLSDARMIVDDADLAPSHRCRTVALAADVVHLYVGIDRPLRSVLPAAASAGISPACSRRVARP